MPQYRRAIHPGGTFFFTAVSHSRHPIFASTQSIDSLRHAFRKVISTHPFTIDAIVVLPEHLHSIWSLPPGEKNFSVRWQQIKRQFTRDHVANNGMEIERSRSRRLRRERSIWQRRFWEHVIRDDHEFERICDYIHYNPVKHGHAACPHAWALFVFRTIRKCRPLCE